MSDFAYEGGLLWWLSLTAAVAAAAWVAVRRLTAGRRSQLALDSALLFYLIQYGAVGLPGVVGLLSPISMTATALLLASVTVVISFVIRQEEPRTERTRAISGFRPSTAYSAGTLRARLSSNDLVDESSRCQIVPSLPVAFAIFAGLYACAYVWVQSAIPLSGNDAMTYHFPAAVQWLQTGRIGLYPTWFFNPANTYSPLAGSTFIAWLLAPIGSDVLARYVELPALAMIGMGVYRLSREMKATRVVSAAVAAAVVCCRPMFLQLPMGKDDLFVVAFFLAAIVATSPVFAGVAIGLLLATKYTALMTLPVLALSIERRSWRWWVTTVGTAAVIAGPWYLRNWIVAGNPLFPLAVPGLGGLFTSAPSSTLHATGGWRFIVGGTYAMPAVVAGGLLIGWAMVFRRGKAVISDRLVRTCVLGPVVGIGLFWLASPFPEARFVLPFFALMFAAAAAGFSTYPRLASGCAIGLLVTSVVTSLSGSAIEIMAYLAAVSLALTAAAIGWSYVPSYPRRIGWLVVIFLAGCWTYVRWAGYCREYRQLTFDEQGGYVFSGYGGDQTALWRFVDQNVPADATVAYAGLYLTFPLQGPELKRRVVYAPTRPGLKTIADLPFLGRGLSGEQLVVAATAATVDRPDEATWLANLGRGGAAWLVVGRSPESGLAAKHRERFRLAFRNRSGEVWRITP